MTKTMRETSASDWVPAGEPIDIWPGHAPSEQTAELGRVSDDRSGSVARWVGITCPQMLAYPLEGEGAHPAVLVLPGGGYEFLAADLEGEEIARWLNSLGFSAFVLHYRVPDNRPGALQDAQRALSLLRAGAKNYNIDPERLGTLGFSAGGHLSARVSNNFHARSYTPVDEADQASPRPDFTVLVYPAYLVDKKTGQIAPEVQPHHDTPPTFITQPRDDPHFDADDYIAALQQSGVPVGHALYGTGGHGQGLRRPDTDEAKAWSVEAGKWLQAQARLT